MFTKDQKKNNQKQLNRLGYKNGTLQCLCLILLISNCFYDVNDDKIFKAINGLVDGFKITYAKITKANLMNQVGFIKN